ncbi:Ubiquitin-like domain-containing protein [Plasmodiophora brassicae]|uniref:Ubiquitin-like domain-containing protein n=2 Tax=Plasmodiophora brassicae TaxID=37360 RepID=A0A3P3XYW7_PLABS|nr:unnamed protein product [Plasmodiophora brassicae]
MGGRGEYLRLKRQKTTVFVHADPEDTIRTVKERLGEAIGVTPEDIRVHRSLDEGNPPLDESLSLVELSIANDVELYFALKIKPDKPPEETGEEAEEETEETWEKPVAELISFGEQLSSST